MQQQEAARFFATFSTLERVIQRFLEGLPSPTALAAQSSTGTTVVIHTLSQMSMIQLHAPFLARNPSSRGRVVAGFRAIVQIIRGFDISRSLFMDPIVGVRPFSCVFIGVSKSSLLGPVGKHCQVIDAGNFRRSRCYSWK